MLSKDGFPLENINLEQNADIIINSNSSNKYSRFGHKITVLDINQDGYNDIVVSAPSYNLDSIKYDVIYFFFKFFNRILVLNS